MRFLSPKADCREDFGRLFVLSFYVKCHRQGKNVSFFIIVWGDAETVCMVRNIEITI